MVKNILFMVVKGVQVITGRRMQTRRAVQYEIIEIFYLGSQHGSNFVEYLIKAGCRPAFSLIIQLCE